MKLLKYEVINLSSTIFVIIFAVIFPIIMTLLIASAFGDVEDLVPVHTQLFFQMAMIIPLASMFMGHAVNFAGELESGVVLRFKLFGFKERTLLVAKFIANMIFLTVSLAIYTLVVGLVLEIAMPSIGALFAFIIFFYVFSAILFVLGHAVATFCGRFGTTFGIIMILYFGFMILGGMMGLSTDMMPDGIRHLSMALPLYYISTHFLDFWLGTEFSHWGGLVGTTLGLAVVSVALLALAFWLKKKGKIKDSAKPVYYD